MAPGEGGVPIDFDPNRWNASQLRRRGDSTPEQLRGELEAAHRDMVALLDSLGDAAFDNRGQLSSGAEGSTEDNFPPGSLPQANTYRRHPRRVRLYTWR
jgi:hypothetical protein